MGWQRHEGARAASSPEGLDVVLMDQGVWSHQHESMRQRLAHEHPIEWVPVKHREGRHAQTRGLVQRERVDSMLNADLGDPGLRRLG